ncbi:metallophosphoesterase [Spirosoma sordidisoli]|uniref:T9SS type A sorting domain-containing protein n=1 Tax=Spirosoma sordidisoli TaxID=2502893 RepID=A0A4Q2UHA8_9BACT|nr:metallophosphoesterase [Spirosoma sordidisoli]RYC68767.1 T9SS type A sorting domain-containing protein [Spirosoma sordidisoli]
MIIPLRILVILFLAGYQAVAQSPVLTRGPYWQVVTPTSAIVRWQTSQPTTGRVWFGTNANSLSGTIRETQPSTDHVLTLTGLQPATRYAYAVGYDDTQLAAGPDYYIKTAPLSGSTQPFRLWVLGDFGNGTDNQREVYRAYRAATTNRPSDLWVWLGDNAYCCGKDDEYQRYVFDVYGPSLRNIPIFPTPGNHDYADSRTNFDIAYYRLFSFPERGEAGGVASGTKTYFSANYGNVHLISLDSQAQQPDDQKRLYDTTGSQVQWLKRDLAANRLPWTIVIFHHPPYSKGSHNSDTEEQMRLLRENLTPILERYGVDLVLNGHSHGYERYYRMRGQTGLANTFDPARHIAEPTSARYDGSPASCPILTKGIGTVYVVNGSGGAQGGVSPDYPHKGMVAGYRGDTWGGSMLLDLNDNRLDAQFIAYDGSVQDKFTILKQVNKTATLTTEFADTLQLAASWPGDSPGAYRWTSGQTSRSIRYVADRAGTFPLTVSDDKQCLADQFTITVPQPPRLTAVLSGITTACVGTVLPVTATPENTTKANGWQYDVLLSDAAGNFAAEQVVGSGTLNALRATLPTSLPAGAGYRLRVRPRGISYATLIASPAFAVRSQPTVSLGGSATVLAGEPASLTLAFTGDAPWRGVLSDGTAFTATTSPFLVSVKPMQSNTYTVRSVENVCGAGTAAGQATITVLLPTATQSVIDSRLRVYPNPVQDRVIVEWLPGRQQDVTLSLIDGQGRVVYQKRVGQAASFTESVLLPAAGVYLLSVQAGQEVRTQKVVKQ